MNAFASNFYSQKQFYLPQFPEINCQPFTILDIKNVLSQQTNLAIKDIPFTYKYQYLKHFQSISGSQTLFPIFIQFIQDSCYICCTDCFIIYNIHDHKNFDKINLPQLPTAFKATDQQILYFGFESGTIIIYNVDTKNIVTKIQQFSFAVVQIQLIGENQIIAIDEFGNLKYLRFTNKKIMDKIIKVSVQAIDIIEKYRIKKIQKIRNFIKGLPFKKSQTKNNQAAYENQEITQQRQKNSKYYPPKFALLKTNNIQQQEQILHLAYYFRGQIKIISLSGQSKILGQQTIMQDISSIGVLEFGYGGFKSSNQTHTILVISTAQIIHFYRSINLETHLEFIKVSEIIHPQKSFIHSGRFISNNLLLYLTQRGIQIANVNQVPQLLHSINFTHFGYIDFFNTEQQKVNKINKILVFRNMLKNIRVVQTKNSAQNSQQQKIPAGRKKSGNSEYVCLEGKRILYGSVYSWKNYLDQIADEANLQNQKQALQKWSKCMKLGLMIYNDKITKLTEVSQIIEKRNQEMRNFFEKIALTYLSFALKLQEIQNKSIIIKEVVGFMVNTQSFDFLSSTIFPIAKQSNLLKEFIQSLKPYICQGKLKSVGDSMLKEIIEFYLDPKLDKQTLDINHRQLQIMFMSFDFQVMEKVQILTYCLNYELFHSLILICTQQKDFVTPLIKLCGLRLNKEKQQDKQVANKLSEIIFWYLKECLVGHMTQFDDNKAYINMLDQLITFIFIPSSIQMLLQTSETYLLRVINTLFSTKIMQYIMQNNQVFRIKRNQYLNEKIFMDRCSQFKIYQEMLCTLIMTIKKLDNKIYLREVLKFQTYLILKNTFPFTIQYKIQAFFYAVDHPFSFLQQKQQLDAEMSSSKQSNGRNFIILRILDSILVDILLEQNIKDRQKTLYQLVNELQFRQIIITQEQNTQIRKQTSKLLTNKQILFKLQIIYAKGLIFYQLGKYSQVIQNFLKSKCTIFINSIFDYMTKIIFQKNQTTTITPIVHMIEYLITNFMDFVKINLNSALDIITKIPTKIDYQYLGGYQYFLNIIHKLERLDKNQNQNYCLKFIEDILHNLPQLEDNYKSNLLKEHLEIVVRDKINELEYYILRMDYPLEQAFSICQKLNNKSALAYIHIKNGRNKQGVYMLTQIFLTKSKEAFRDIAKNIDSNLLPKMSEQLDIILETCTKQYMNDNIKGQQLWQKIADKIFKDLNAKNVENIGIVKIKTILKQYIDRIVTKMFSQVTAEFFIDKYAQKMKNMPASIFLKAFKLLYQRLEFTHVIKSFAKQLLRKNQLNSFQNLLHISTKGLSVHEQQQCNKCAVFLHHLPQIICYYCGHYYHKTCQSSQAIKCPICEQNKFLRISDIDIIQGDIKFKEKTDNRQYYKSKQSFRKQSFIEKSHRMLQFDKIVDQFYSTAYLTEEN